MVLPVATLYFTNYSTYLKKLRNASRYCVNSIEEVVLQCATSRAMYNTDFTALPPIYFIALSVFQSSRIIMILMCYTPCIPVFLCLLVALS